MTAPAAQLTIAGPPSGVRAAHRRASARNCICAGDRLAGKRVAGAGVDAQRDLWVEELEERVEVAVARGGK
jgi:hypothetical protein